MGRRKKNSAARSTAATTGWSLADLTALVAETERRVKSLGARRAELAGELAQVDAELATLTGAKRRGRPPRAIAAVAAKPGRKKAAGRGRKPGRPPKAGRGPGRRGRSADGSGTLTDYIRNALTGVESLKLKQIQEAVVAAGYPTKSANLGIIISQRLPEMKDVVKVARGVYALRGAAAGTRKAAAAPKATTGKAGTRKAGTRKAATRKKATRKASGKKRGRPRKAKTAAAEVPAA